MSPSPFVGRHLLLDVRTRDARALDDPHAINDVLIRLTHGLGMTLVTPPIVARFPSADSGDAPTLLNDSPSELRAAALLAKRAPGLAGVTGVCLWLESHASIHTWTEHAFFSFDAFSCRDFASDDAIQVLGETFDIASLSGLNIVRTLDGPRDVTPVHWTR